MSTVRSAPACSTPTALTVQAAPQPSRGLGPGWQPYTVVDGVAEQGVGARVWLTVTLARSSEEALRHFHDTHGEQGQPDVFEGVHRPVLERYLALGLIADIERQLGTSGTVDVQWSLHSR